MVHVDTDALGGIWDRGDGRPQQRGLNLVVDVVLDNCSPLEVVLFGSGARGELGVASDLDVLVVLADLVEPRRALSFRIEETIAYHPRVEIVVATEREVRDASTSLASVLRTASEEGVVLYRRGERLPYAPQPRPPVVAGPRLAGPAVVDEASVIGQRAARALYRAEISGGAEWSECMRTELAGSARKAVEFAFQSVIVAAGRRPRAWKDPAGLAAEAAAVCDDMPVLDAGALSRAANYYAGTAYPEYPSPSRHDALEALDLARQVVPWAEAVRDARAQALGCGAA